MTKHTWCPAIWGVALGLLAALAAWPQPASAQLSGSGMTIAAFIHTDQGTGPFFADIVVGPGVELPDGSGRLGGYPRRGESVDCENFKCVFSFARSGLQGAFELTGLNSPIERELLEITISGNLLASSNSHVSAGNEEGGSFARFTVDCNPFLAVNPCTGGTVEVNFVFAAIPPEEVDTSIKELIDFVVAQNFPPGTENPLVNQLESALMRLEGGETRKAIGKMNDFIVVTRRKEAGGTIDTAIADAMVALAEDIIEAIKGLGGTPPPQ